MKWRRFIALICSGIGLSLKIRKGLPIDSTLGLTPAILLSMLALLQKAVVYQSY